MVDTPALAYYLGKRRREPESSAELGKGHAPSRGECR